MRDREPKELLVLLARIAEDNSLKLSEILGNLEKISNLYGLRITESERIKLKSFLFKNQDPKHYFDIAKVMNPKYNL